MFNKQYVLAGLFALFSFAIIILIILLYQATIDKTTTPSGYIVVAKYSDRENAARTLHKLNLFGLQLIDKMHKKYKHNEEAMSIIARLLNKYDPDKLQENDPIFTFKHKAYTLNFQKIAICLRLRNGEFYDYNTLQFVFLHELSHIGSLERDHNDHFWTVFKYILVCAVQMTDYTPVDYSATPINYCGINVSNNPYYSDADISKYMSTL